MFRIGSIVKTECCKVLATIPLICQTLRPEHLLIHLEVLKNAFLLLFCAILRSLCFIVSTEQGDSNPDKQTKNCTLRGWKKHWQNSKLRSSLYWEVKSCSLEALYLYNCEPSVFILVTCRGFEAQCEYLWTCLSGCLSSWLEHIMIIRTWLCISLFWVLVTVFLISESLSLLFVFFP